MKHIAKKKSGEKSIRARRLTSEAEKEKERFVPEDGVSSTG
jgi:hypothetical protein